MPHDMPQDWNVVAPSTPLTLLALVAMFPLLVLLFRGLETKDCQPNVPRVIAAGMMVFVCCPLLCFSLMLFMSGCSAAWVEFRMHQDGTLTDTGVVKEKFVRTTREPESGAATSHYCLQIDFKDHGGNMWQVEREVDERSWKRHDAGNRLPEIEYLQSEPKTWRFAAESGLWLRLLLRGGLLAALVIALRLIAGLVLPRTRRSC